MSGPDERARRALGRSRAAIAASVALLAIVAAVLGAYALMGRAAQDTEPSPGLAGAVEDDGFPKVDWDYWHGVNGDVVGWITVPGTNIDGPVLQEHPDNVGWWLTHDVHGNWNVYGAYYVDAECPAGLASKNAVILGHHMSDGTMFATVASYGDLDFMREHRTVLLQTPEWKRAFNVGAAEVVAGWDPVKRTAFESDEDFRGYVAERIGRCGTVDRDPTRDGAAPARMLTLVTCSYTTFSNERTLAYAW